VIQDRSEKLAAFYERHFGRASENSQAHSNGDRSEMSDEEVVRLCRGARNAPKFEALYDRGDLGEYAGDNSRADQALISILAFYTQDSEQLDRLFRDSTLYRSEKWGRRPDYRRRTIQKALSNLTETYAPADDGARMVVGNGHATRQSPSLYKQGDLRNGAPLRRRTP
jgi:putative DNA primase/helicase